MRVIKVKVKADSSIVLINNQMNYKGEDNFTVLQITINEIFADLIKHIEFSPGGIPADDGIQNPNCIKIGDPAIVDMEFVIPQYLTYSDFQTCQFLFTNADESVIAKSAEFKLQFLDSINATEELVIVPVVDNL